MEKRPVKLKLRYFILAGVIIYILAQIHLNSDAHYNTVAAPKIKAYMEQVRSLKDFHEDEGYIHNIAVQVTDEHPNSRSGFKYRAIGVFVSVKLEDSFENLRAVEQCRRLYAYDKALTGMEREIRESTGYGEAVEAGLDAHGEYISDGFRINFRTSAHAFYFDSGWGSMSVVVPGAYGAGAKGYSFHIKDGEIQDFRAEKSSYSSSGSSGTSTKKSSTSGNSSYSGSGKSSSGGKRRSAYSDPYDVNDYDDPDDFAEEWAEEFADFVDGDYDDGYDEAYDYWEENR